MRKRWLGALHAAAFAGSLTLAGVLAAPGPADAAMAACQWTDGMEPPPVPSLDASFTSVAVPSATSAWAVGSATDSHNNPHALIEHWNGSAWTTARLPRLGVSWLNGVRSATPASVWAVGTIVVPGKGERALILHWNGKAWSRQASPDPTKATEQLGAVRAVSPTNAWAVGQFGAGSGFRALILHWNGTAWTQVSSPSPGPSADLSGVAATSPVNAWAVGAAGNLIEAPRRGNLPGSSPASGAAGKALILRWNGKKWSQAAIPSLSAGTSDALGAVGATSATNAWAAGNVIGAQVDQTLILHWNGKTWQRVPSPDPGGRGVSNDLAGVTATSAGNAWAVGTFDDHETGGTVPEGFILRWDGSHWRPAENLAGHTRLFGVAASSAANAWAVGAAIDDTTGQTQPLALHCTSQGTAR
jgi:hypothetical protein